MTWFERLRSSSPVGSKQQWKELFEHSPVMYFILDAAGTVLAVNALGAAQLGYATGELVGQSVLKVFFAEDQEAARHNMALCLQRLGQQNNWEIRKVRKDGTLLWVRENAKAVRRSGDHPIVLIACEDITDRKRGEQRLAAQYGVTRVLAESDSLIAATPHLLRSMCENLEWDWGALWNVDHQTGLLRCNSIWHAPDVETAEFDAMSREVVLMPGEGQAGRAWQDARPVWLADAPQDSDLLRGSAAAGAGLNGCLALPILVGGEALGVVELFSREVRMPDDQQLVTLSAVGSQIGQFIKRKRAEEAVQASEKRFRALIEHAYDVVLLVNAQGAVLYASPSLEQVLGYAPEELTGRSGFGLVHPDHLQDATSQFARLIEQPDEVVTGERMMRHKDGSLRWVESAAANLLLEPSVQAVVVNLRDISRRKRAEERLRESERRFRDYAETASDWLWESGPDHRFTQVSERPAALGMDFAHAVGTTRWELAGDYEEEPDKWRAHLATLEARQPFRGFSYRTMLADGSVIYVATSGKPIFDRGGRFLGYRGVSTDISAAVRADQAERALRDARTELAHVARVTTLGELAASIAHEVNQPLGAIVTDASACLRWLDRESPNLPEARDTLGRIIRDANRAADVIGRIRALTRNSPIRMDQLDINEVVRDVVALTRREMERNRIALQTQLAADLPMIQGDRVQLQQLILNLIINAIEAMGSDGPRDLLVASKQDEYRNVLVAVQDSGLGLDPGSIGHIFDAFYTTKSGGMGMGLAICRSIIETHGGRLWASSNPSRGACFQFALPADQVDAQEPHEAAITPSPRHNTP